MQETGPEYLVSVDGLNYPGSCLELKLCNYMSDFFNLNSHDIFNIIHCIQSRISYWVLPFFLSSSNGLEKMKVTLVHAQRHRNPLGN